MSSSPCQRSTATTVVAAPGVVAHGGQAPAPAAAKTTLARASLGRLVEHGDQAPRRVDRRHRLGALRAARDALAVADAHRLLVAHLVHGQLGPGGLGHRQQGYAVTSVALGRRGERLERVSLREVEAADPGAPQGRQVAADPEQVTEVTGEGAHVGARRHVHLHVDVDDVDRRTDLGLDPWRGARRARRSG